MYAAAEFAALAGWCREVCDEIALPAGPQTRDRMQTAFLTSSRHALAFWDAAWTALDEPGADDRSP